MLATLAYLTLGSVAKQFGLPVWKIRRLFERGILAPAGRIGQYRVIPAGDLPVIEAALRQVGYLPKRGGGAG